MSPRRSTSRTLRRLMAICSLVALILLVPPPASGGLCWDVAQAAGYGALGAAVLLFIYPLRGRPGERRLLSLAQHERLGYLVLGLICAHVLLLLLLEPQTHLYLLPSAPLYMLAGTLALIGVATLVTSGLVMRQRLRHAAPSAVGRPLVLLHASCAVLIVALLALHIVGSGQGADRGVKIAVLCAELGTALLWSTWRQSARRRRPGAASVPLLALACALLLGLLPAPAAPPLLRNPPVSRSTRLPLDFPHSAHRGVNCISCHHNFVDRTGTGSCLDCHRSPRPDLPYSSESTFHTFCRDCHAQRAREHQGRHGPTRGCARCHSTATGGKSSSPV